MFEVDQSSDCRHGTSEIFEFINISNLLKDDRRSALSQTKSLISLALVLLFSVSAHGQFFHASPMIGTNMDAVEDFSPSVAFVDIFKLAREWTPERAGQFPAPDVLNEDADGWVTSLPPGLWATTFIMPGVGPHYPSGTYTVLYDGTGTLEFRNDASVTSSVPGQIMISVSPSNNGIMMRLRSTNPADNLRNIRIIAPGFESTYTTQIFHPNYLTRLSPFEVVRFMDWQRITSSALTTWSQRTTLNTATQTNRYGVAVEYMVELCNRLNLEPWFCIPHRADDTFVLNFATYVRDNLNSDLRIYIEYSNEVWNGQFSQGIWIQLQALSNGVPGVDDFQKRMHQYGARSVEIFDIWETVFGGTTQLVRVVASQHANTGTATSALDYVYNPAGVDGVNRKVSDKTDALAIAPYFGFDLGSNPEAGTAVGLYNPAVPTSLAAAVDYAIGFADADVDTQLIKVAQNKTLADARGVRLIAYEGGQHMVGVGVWAADNELTTVLTAANRDPRMEAMYKRYIEGWRVATADDLFVSFTLVSKYNRFGSWGLLEWSDVPTNNAYKYIGLFAGFEQDVAGLVAAPTQSKGVAVLLLMFLAFAGWKAAKHLRA